jgi:hypothetical protein
VVTNAVLHAGTSIDVRLELPGSGELRVDVTDRSPSCPCTGVRGAGHDRSRHGAGRGVRPGLWRRAARRRRQDRLVRHEYGRRSEDQSEQDLLEAWGIELDETAAPVVADDGHGKNGSTTFWLLGLPPKLWLAAKQHHDALLRELTLYGAEHPDEVPGPDRLALAGLPGPGCRVPRISELDRPAWTPAAGGGALPAIPATLSAQASAGVDVAVEVPADGAQAFLALQDVLDRAEQLAVGDRLLIRPALPEISACAGGRASRPSRSCPPPCRRPRGSAWTTPLRRRGPRPGEAGPARLGRAVGDRGGTRSRCR